MGFFSAFTKVVVETVQLPVAIVKDVVTLGGTIIDQPSSTAVQAKRIKEAAEDKSDDEMTKKPKIMD